MERSFENLNFNTSHVSINRATGKQGPVGPQGFQYISCFY